MGSGFLILDHHPAGLVYCPIIRLKTSNVKEKLAYGLRPVPPEQVGKQLESV